MTVADETVPQSGDLVVVQPEEVAGDGSSRETGDEHFVGVAAVLDDHRRQKPDYLVKVVREKQLPFPVGIDRQRDQERSVSLALYRGNAVPWGVFLDRYGRMVWIGPLPVERNVFKVSYTWVDSEIEGFESGAFDRFIMSWASYF